MIKPLFIFIFCFAVLGFSSCEIINPEEEIPAYIEIDTFLFSTSSYAQGASTHKITDAWINVNGEFIGLYELPCKIPVIGNGPATFQIKPGIKNNGIAASRVHYPFYTIYELDTALAPLSQIKITPQCTYYESTKFDWIENFEDPGISIDTNFTSLVSINDTTINGSHAAKIVMHDSLNFFHAETTETFDLPGGNVPTLYLEMDYYCNNSFTVGIQLRSSTSITYQPVIFLNPQEKLNKIYIDFTYFSQTSLDIDGYKVYFEGARNDTITRSVIVFDNLKLVRF